MMILKNKKEIEKLLLSNQLVARTLRLLRSEAEPGVSTLYLDRLAEKKIREEDGIPGFLGYRGYPYSICASVNEKIVHGFPTTDPLKEGDLLSIDVGVLLDGYYGDAAISIAVGRGSEAVNRLIQVTEECLHKGIEQALPGNRLGDVSNAIQVHAENNNYGIVRDYGGHGVGKILHEDPHVSNYGRKKEGELLKEGLVLAIEPMLTEGRAETKVLADGWTVVTKDGSNAAHFEHTIAILDGGPLILSHENIQGCAACG